MEKRCCLDAVLKAARALLSRVAENKPTSKSKKRSGRTKKSRFISIKSSFEFDFIYKNGKKIRLCPWLTVISHSVPALKNQPIDLSVDEKSNSLENTTSYYGITASRKVGSAVIRNKLKRWIRNCAQEKSWPTQLINKKAVFIFRPQAEGFYKNLKFEDFFNVFKGLSKEIPRKA